ncbi:MAG: molybdopterin-dependent oxidoreductase, partial [Anaerolineae bacterium]
MRTLECISNPAGGTLISNTMWKGIRLKDLLARVGVKAGTAELKLESIDGYSTAIPLGLGQDDHSLLVYEMNGVPLPLEHGEPLRCLWPGHYGMKQPKWLTHISAITTHYDGFWEQQGWSNEAPIRPFSRIDKPGEDATVSGGTLDVNGIGFSGSAGIAKIELSLDGGKTWQPVDLVRGPTPYVWTQWNWRGPTPPDGQVTLFARVTDRAGDVQNKPSLKLLGDTFPNGSADMQPVIITVKKG